MKTMYPAVVNSPPTMILGAIGATETTITVLDDTNIPEPPNLLVIGGTSIQSETVLLTAKNGTTLTVERGFQGTARGWNTNTMIGRNFTAYDYDAHTANIAENTTAIGGEVTRATGVESGLSTALGQEATRAQGVEQGLQTATTANAQKITGEITRAQGVEDGLQEQVNTSAADIAKNALDIAAEATTRGQADTAINALITAIQALIPTQAAASNQLADKSFVNSSIQTMTANYVTYNAAGDAFPTLAALNGASKYYHAGAVYTPKAKDYVTVLSDANAPSPYTNGTTRRTYDGSVWAYSFGINEEPLTAAQIAALNSGATAAIIASITSKTDKVTSATAGNFAALNTSGNLTDSGLAFSASADGSNLKFRIGGVWYDISTGGGGGMSTLGALLAMFVNADGVAPAGLENVTTWAAIWNNTSYKNAVVGSPTAMAYICENLIEYAIQDTKAMAAVAASSTARTAIEGSSTAVNALNAKATKTITDAIYYGTAASTLSNLTLVQSGYCWVKSISSNNTALTTGYYSLNNSSVVLVSGFNADVAIGKFATSGLRVGSTYTSNGTAAGKQVVYAW